MQDTPDWQPLFAAKPQVDGSGLYLYDALYRVTYAQGREHPGQQVNNVDSDILGIKLPNASDMSVLAQYAEDYLYDEVGNIASVHHGLLIANPLFPDWTRNYTYETNNNQLKTATEPVGDTPNPYPYTYNEHGSMTSMAHLQAMDWDFAERLQHVNKGGGGDVYFVYDASGQRTRKVYVHSGLREERIYVGGYEVYRKRVDAAGSPVDLERQTVHVMDNLRRVAMVESKTIDTTPSWASAVTSE